MNKTMDGGIMRPEDLVKNESDKIDKLSKSTGLNDKRILILFPCSGAKQKTVFRETFDKTEEKKVVEFIENTRGYLLKGREGLLDYIDKNSPLAAALDRYNGNLYKIDNFRETVKKACLKKDVHILIMSGAYGILLPAERTHYYERSIIARYWKQNRLPEVIEEYIEKNKITHVYGFFSLTTDYMKIMRSIDWQMLKNYTDLKEARTYYINFQGTGGAQVIVPQTIGMLIVSFIKSNFSQDNFYSTPFSGQYVEFIDHLEM
jgi:hypothetical protein